LVEKLNVLADNGKVSIVLSIEKFEAVWGDKIPVPFTVWNYSMLGGAVQCLAGGLVCVAAQCYYTATFLICGSLVFLVLAFWRRHMQRRMKFDGHFIHAHDDMRPDHIKTKDVTHSAQYGYVRYTFGGVERRLLISYEVLAQLCTPDLMRIDRDPDTALSAFSGAVGRIPSVNYDRFLPISGENLLQNTALVAYGKFCAMKDQIEELDFGLPPADCP